MEIRASWGICALIFASVLIAACNGKVSQSEAPEDVAENGTGVLTGSVQFAGAPPPPRPLQITKDPEVCQNGAGEVVDVVTAADGGLAGAVVEVQGVGGDGAAAAGKPYVLTQKNCRFSPGLVALPDGAQLTVVNGDPILHNINTGQWNIAQPFEMESLQAVRYMGQSFVRANCNVHSWMEAWLYVARSPHYAVTDEAGRFRIDGIPAGTYPVTVAHPTLGTERSEVTIPAGGTVEHRVTLR